MAHGSCSRFGRPRLPRGVSSVLSGDPLYFSPVYFLNWPRLNSAGSRVFCLREGLMTRRAALRMALKFLFAVWEDMCACWEILCTSWEAPCTFWNGPVHLLSLIHISEPTRPEPI
eukprot:1342047-Pyramimonas_sp.AAC.1